MLGLLTVNLKKNLKINKINKPMSYNSSTMKNSQRKKLPEYSISSNHLFLLKMLKTKIKMKLQLKLKRKPKLKMKMKMILKEN